MEKEKSSFKSAVISGNGESLLKIDYNRLPQNYDVFRCNQFYFEDKYFLGKKIHYAFFTPEVFFEQYYTAFHLIQNKDYEIDNIVCTTFGNAGVDIPAFVEVFKNHFLKVKFGDVFIKRLTDFYTTISFNELYHQKRITSGVYMCACAVAMGYNHLYITGIDFYQGTGNYAFDTRRKGLLRVLPQFANQKSVNAAHHKNYDLYMLNYLVQNYGVKIYSISPESPLVNYFPLAEKNENYNEFKVEEKSSSAIKDLILPSKDAYLKLQHNLQFGRAYNYIIISQILKYIPTFFLYKVLRKIYRILKR